MYRIAVMGDERSVLGCAALGLEVYPVSGAEEARTVLHRLAREEVAIIYMTEQLAAWKEEYPDTFAATIKGIPLGRFGDPKTDIAPVAVFLASDMASYVSGETITIQGGSGLRP